MKRHAPAAARNRDSILAALQDVLPASGKVLEIGSGTGEHALHFAAHLPALRWQPSDPDPVQLASIAAHRLEAALPNLLEPARLDAREADWGPLGEALAAIVCINVIHISPWETAMGLFSGAGRLLPAGAPLITYGPYRFDGAFTAPSNETFDRGLRDQDPAWGVRDVSELVALGEAHGLRHEQTLPMPANNHVLVFRRAALAGG
jgi:hypothetical protein